MAEAEAESKRPKVENGESPPQPISLTKKVQNLEMKEQIELSIRLNPLSVSGNREVSMLQSTIEGYKVKVKYQLRENGDFDGAAAYHQEYYLGLGRRVLVGERVNPEGQPVVLADRPDRVGLGAYRRSVSRGRGILQGGYPPEYCVEVVIVPEVGDPAGYTVDLSLYALNDNFARFDKATGQLGTTIRVKTIASCVLNNGAMITCKIHGTMSPTVFKPEAYLHAKAMMSQMYLERESTGDLTIETKTGAHKVHGWLLSRQSDMFLAMLTHDMKEKQNRVVKMEDFEDAVVLNLLEYVYTGWTDSVNTDPQSLLSIAHMFQVETLITRCWETFMANLSVDTAVSLLLLADKLGAVDQKKKIGKFLLEHHDLIRKTEEFKQLVNQHSRLYLEICDM